MAIAYISGSFESSLPENYTYSTTVTVPSNASMMVFGWVSSQSGRHVSYATIGSSSFTKGIQRGYANNSVQHLWYCENPPTGAQTFYVEWGDYPNSRPLGWCFLSGTAISSPIRTTGSGYGTTSATTENMTVVAGDMAVCVFFSYSTAGTITVTGNSQYLIGNKKADTSTYNQLSLAYKEATVDSSTFYMTGTNNSYPAIAAMVIKPAPDAKGIPPTLILPKHFRTHLVR